MRSQRTAALSVCAEPDHWRHGNDLYAVALPAMAKAGRENAVHFSPEGYALLAEAVAHSIKTALKK